jgi:hypothetical protein
MTGYPTHLETLLASVAGLYSASTPPVGVDPSSATALAGLLPLFPAERVYVTLAPDAMFADDPPCDQFIVIRPDRYVLMPELFAGGGNMQVSTDGGLELTLWNRFEADTPLSDASALSDTTYGILALWRPCLVILSGYMPTDEDGNGLCLEPIRLVNWSVEPRQANDPWSLLRSRWSMKFTQAFP